MLKDQQQLNLNSTTSNPLSSDATPVNMIDQDLARKQVGQYEIVPDNLLDLFDIKYSCSFLTMPEQHDLFYSNQINEHGNNDAYPRKNSKKGRQ